jgi:hypothetical protein
VLHVLLVSTQTAQVVAVALVVPQVVTPILLGPAVAPLVRSVVTLILQDLAVVLVVQPAVPPTLQASILAHSARWGSTK